MTTVIFHYQLENLRTKERMNFTSDIFLGEKGEKVCFVNTGSWEIINWDCEEVDFA